MMTPEAFIKKWQDAKTKESAAAQEHFIDLCRLLGEPTPNEADPAGVWYCFEKGAAKAGGGEGWADVWKKDCFGWEYKGKGKNLQAALKQLQGYALALHSPPLLIVCDLDSIVIHTAFRNAVQQTHVIALADIAKPEARQKLKWVFTDPDRLHPGQTRENLTQDAARRFANLAQGLHGRGFEPHTVAHFLNRLLFCLFAEDCDLLPRQLFSRLLESAAKAPQHGEAMLKDLFEAMAKGGACAFEVIDWFNGGLFNDSETLPLSADEFKQLLALSRLDWSDIEPAIFGTLFERGLDPAKRSQLGAHYTDRESIMRLINPIIREPLLSEWEAVKGEIQKDKTKGRNKAQKAYIGFLERLRQFRVLDPACGSGNFLYLALQTLKDLEHQAILEAETLGLPRQFPSVGPEAVHGIELNPYAAELARVTVWIGEIQWMLQHGYDLNRNPVLRPLDTIEQRDAILDIPDVGRASARQGVLKDALQYIEAQWPEADVIIGNPPFLGDKKMVSSLGEDYTNALRSCYKGRVPGGADLVCYWFEKARTHIETGKAKRAGLVATNSIRGGANRKVLERINESGRIFYAWSDEPWINEGAAVRVSLVGFTGKDEALPVVLNGNPTGEIYADLTMGTTAGEGVNLTKAGSLPENKGFAFNGIQKTGPFDIVGTLARTWLKFPNPHGKPNSDVLRPYWNGLDLTRGNRDMWVIDFGWTDSETAASLYEAPFEYALNNIKPSRLENSLQALRDSWWRHWRPRPEMRTRISEITRYIITPEVSKYRLFAWLKLPALPDKNLIVVARSDNATFGVLHSRFHELWALRMGTSLEDRPRYTPTTTFETFPFPEGVLTPHPGPLPEGEGVYDPDARFPAIAEAAKRLNELRENWLNPPEWVERVPEIISPLTAGEGQGVRAYPDRIIPKPGHEADLKKRTLTNLYNQRPAWLDNAHKALDKAVAEAYGWADYTPAMPDEEILSRLLALNLERSRPEPADPETSLTPKEASS
jgi:type II restriction/modification system DNA methylase subunit YeeA